MVASLNRPVAADHQCMVLPTRSDTNTVAVDDSPPLVDGGPRFIPRAPGNYGIL